MKAVRWDHLGDQGILLGFSDPDDAFAFAQRLRDAPPPGVVDVVQAYTTVAVYHDPDALTLQQLKSALQPRVDVDSPTLDSGLLHRIPCCYEYGEDLQAVSQVCQLDPDQLIALHTGTTYRVFAIGFCPGFPYLGYLPHLISNVPRLATPRTRVEPGSVGLTGRQTGIYTLPRPGGWSIIGRTPLVLVDVEDNYFPLRTGNRVEFVRIDEPTFHSLLGERLPRFS